MPGRRRDGAARGGEGPGAQAGEVDAVVALLVELTASNASVAPVVPVTSTAGPPVALTFVVPAAGTDTVPALESPKAAVAPLVWSARGRRTWWCRWCWSCSRRRCPSR